MADELIDLAPHIKLLLAMAATLELVDYQVRAGASKPVKIRHARNRKPVRSEKPAISIIFVGDDPRPDDLQRNAWEAVRELQADLQCDADLAAEDSEEDVTGLAVLSRILAAGVEMLEVARRDVVTPFNDLADSIMAGTVDPDDKSREDDGRLVRRVTVVYRVRTDGSNVLLAPGEQG
ncbi:MAG TPA: hypothetical protein VGA98_02630 [Allosphingosinicella sp.]|jgi:hypothetical protein